MVEVRNLQMRFGPVTALADVTFRAPDGRITALLGENGAGKTTTLSIVSGLHQPHRGDVVVNGASSSPAERRRNVGALLDHKGLYTRLTVRENVAYFGALRGFTGADLNARVERALQVVGLGAIANRRTEGFSQGERMKVALARAMVHTPQNLLLDEATNGLDIPSARSFKAALREMRDRGVCIVFSSHMVSDIGALCDDVVLISRGRTIAQGEPSALCERAGCTSLEEAFMVLTRSQEERTCLPG